MSPEGIVAIVVAAIAALPGIWAIVAGRKRENADTSKAIAEAAAVLVKPLEGRIVSLEKEMRTQEERVRRQTIEIERLNGIIRKQQQTIVAQATRIKQLEDSQAAMLAGIEKLCNQIRAGGQEPVWEPEIVD